METYLYGQGKVEVALITNNTLGPWVWIGDVSELTASISEETFKHKESHSGKKLTARQINYGAEMTVSATLHELSTSNIARFTDGTNTTTASGTVTDEALGTVAADDVFQLDQFNVSDVVITDSAGTPLTIDPSHYEVDIYGELKFLSLPDPAPTQPLKASYSYGESNQVAFLNGTRSQLALRYKGVNLAEDNKPIMMELYKVSPSLLQTLSLITNGNQLASAPVTFEALIDTSKPATGALGQIGRIVTGY